MLFFWAYQLCTVICIQASDDNTKRLIFFYFARSKLENACISPPTINSRVFTRRTCSETRSELEAGKICSPPANGRRPGRHRLGQLATSVRGYPGRGGVIKLSEWAEVAMAGYLEEASNGFPRRRQLPVAEPHIAHVSGLLCMPFRLIISQLTS
ncbi:hypothetical protein B0H63DRAFT_23220 [Podospora didyma]|uniref:Uncharacterized protein n=1 Tax=Podospora didyma TaxID=330526 RepID=A0AAE0P5A3_9PEZI|nr:hypothetical protein B0H63DRAFT_23220 [Podospora didyma]